MAGASRRVDDPGMIGRKLILLTFTGILLSGCAPPKVENVKETVAPTDLPALEARFEMLLGQLESRVDSKEVTTIRRGWEAMKELGQTTPEDRQHQVEYLIALIRLLELAIDPDTP